MTRTPARIHLHFVAVEGTADLYTVEVRQGSRARTIGRVSGGQGSSWIGLAIGGTQWSTWVKTRRAAVEPLLAVQRLQLAGKGGTLVDVSKPGDVVDYRGSIDLMHDRYVLGAEDSAGRWTLIYAETGDVALRQVRRESFTPTGGHVDMCGCGHQLAAHLPEQIELDGTPSTVWGVCTAYPCLCDRTAGHLAA